MGNPASPSPRSLRAIIADDHPSALMLVAKAVRRCRCRVAHVSTNGDDLFEAVRAGAFDLAVTDLVMPGAARGLSLLRSLRQERDTLPVIVYTAIDTPVVSRLLLDAGAMGFVTKASSPDVLAAAIEAVMGGEAYVDSSIDIGETDAHPWLSLSHSERRVAIAVSRGMSLKAIALEGGRSYSTVSAQKYSAQEKLGTRTDADLITYLHRTGLIHVLA